MTPARPILHRWRALAVLAVAYFMTIVELDAPDHPADAQPSLASAN